MITIKCPVRVSLIGGSSDLDSYINKHGKGSVISFTPKLYTYVSLYRDKLGRNSLDQKYIINYSNREEVIPYTDENYLAIKLELGYYDVRFLGDDYRDKKYTAVYLPVKVIYTDRSHGYSTTDLKQKVANSYLEFIK
jgi:hypothetical protein